MVVESSFVSSELDEEETLKCPDVATSSIAETTSSMNFTDVFVAFAIQFSISVSVFFAFSTAWSKIGFVEV